MRSILFKWRVIFIPLGIALFLSVISFVVMTLWNNLLPDILNVDTITFWQAMGIFILSKLLFGFGRGGKMGKASWGKDGCKSMSPEDRERFKAEMKNRMCNWGGSPKDVNSENLQAKAD